jgi:acyl-CoA synthetase (AMP-forming)/AMP-acid ligase II
MCWSTDASVHVPTRLAGAGVAGAAALLIGAVAVGIYPTNPWVELQYIVRHSGARVVITGDQEQTDKVLDALANNDGLPALEAVVCIDMKGLRQYRQSQLMSFEALCQRGKTYALDNPDANATLDRLISQASPDDVSILVYTSGTTGPPKGAMLTHRNLIANCEQCDRVERIKPQENDVVWIALPLFHIYAMNVGMNLTVKAGGTMALIERFEPASALESIHTNKCTVLYGAPPMFVVWAQMPNIRDYDLSSVRYIASGAAALPVKIMELFEGMAGVPISEGYGLTEASPVVTTNAAGPITKPGTVGKPIPGVEVRIVDADGIVPKPLMLIEKGVLKMPAPPPGSRHGP